MAEHFRDREQALADALIPFAEACRLIDAQYNRLASDHGEEHIRRPSSDSLSMTFSYGTLRNALEAFEKWITDSSATGARS